MRTLIVLAVGLLVVPVVIISVVTGCSAASAAGDARPVADEHPVAVAAAPETPLPDLSTAKPPTAEPPTAAPPTAEPPTAEAPEAAPTPETHGSAPEPPVVEVTVEAPPAPTPNFPEDPDGSLDAQDIMLGESWYCDVLPLPLEADEGVGQVRLRVAVVASDFAPCVGVVTTGAPEGQFARADGHPFAMLDLTCDVPDEATVVVSSAVAGQTGRYYLCVALGDDEIPGWDWFSGPGAGLAQEAPAQDATGPTWQPLQFPEDYGTGWESGVGPEQVRLFGVRPFSRDCYYMSLTGRARYLHHARTEVWLPREVIDAVLWLPRLSVAISDTILKRIPPEQAASPESEASPSPEEVVAPASEEPVDASGVV